MYPFRDDNVFVDNAWYVAAWSEKIGREITARSILDEPVILYRTHDGAAVALEGTCAHKAYPLSYRRLVDDAVECNHHGFVFDRTGRCVLMPAADHVSPRCQIRAYPLVERWQWIWIWMGDPAEADESLIPATDDLGLTDEWDARRADDLAVDARYQLLNDNLLDLTHIGFLHPKPDQRHRDVTGTTRGTITQYPEHGFQRDTRTVRVSGDSVRRRVKGAPDLDEFEQEICIDFYPPTFHVGRLIYRVSGTDTVVGEIRNFHAFTPRTKHTTHSYLANGRDFAHGDDQATMAVIDNSRSVLPEDKVAVEAIEPLVDRPGRRPDFNAPTDGGVVLGRRWIQRMIDDEVVGNQRL